MCTCK